MQITVSLFVVQVLLIILKVAEVINWSWWLVFLPTLVSWGLFVLALVVLFLVAATIGPAGKGR